MTHYKLSGCCYIAIARNDQRSKRVNAVTEEVAKTTFNALLWRGNTSRQALFPLPVIPGES